MDILAFQSTVDGHWTISIDFREHSSRCISRSMLYCRQQIMKLKNEWNERFVRSHGRVDIALLISTIS
ncbi:MAG: hypothetical protein BVN32_13310 [Proteobacteria bacterium ST_bin14]|nr:MAG: hypothetical protein BVN32_13310 [Proteobacteria bacterium ST_bin14]